MLNYVPFSMMTIQRCCYSCDHITSNSSLAPNASSKAIASGFIQPLAFQQLQHVPIEVIVSIGFGFLNQKTN
jgi:hypothetical protein